MSFSRRLKKADTVYTCRVLYSAIRKNEIMPFAATWMDLEIIILNKVSQKEKDRYYIAITCVWSLKIYTNKFIIYIYIYIYIY